MPKNSNAFGCLYPGLVGAVLLLVVTSEVGAQATSPPTSVQDEYGNAAPPPTPSRRPIGLQLNGGPSAARGYNQSPLGFSHSPMPTLGVLSPSVDRPSAATLLAGRISPMEDRLARIRRFIFSQYGGFDNRTQDRRMEGVAAAFHRRVGLIRATQQATPVQRALLRSFGTMPGLMTPQSWAEAPVPAHTPETPTSTLEQRLTREATNLPIQAKQEGWRWFSDGNYRIASRAFLSAATLDPSDTEARVAAMVCHVTLGALRTAAGLLDQLAREGESAFALDLDLRARYGSEARADEVLARCKYNSQTEAGDDRSIALHVLTLWYLGARDEAVFAAAAIRKRFPESPFAAWPEQMRAVRSRQHNQ